MDTLTRVTNSIRAKQRNEDVEPQKRMDTGRCASKNTGPRMGWNVRSHINRREERVPTRMLGPEATVRSHIDWRGERNILYKGVETSP